LGVFPAMRHIYLQNEESFTLAIFTPPVLQLKECGQATLPELTKANAEIL
jgi:hypothetical protein